MAASSGNAGASFAAYAAAAGLRCVIITSATISPIWARAIRLTGADLVVTDTPSERWQHMQGRVEQEGSYPVTNYLNPPVGSNHFGIQGYKTVAYELVEQCGDKPPTIIVVPTTRGDLLWGIWQGLLDARQAKFVLRLPRLIAVEPFPRLSRVLTGSDYRQEFAGDADELVSIGGRTATCRSLVALQGSNGTAVEASTAEVKDAQKELARLGFYLELSAASSLAGLRRLSRRGHVGKSDRVVAYRHVTRRQGQARRDAFVVMRL